ncbi:MAG: LLM class flavin-dependent oxidoreductase [Nitrososphaerota archaeon]
MLREFGYHIVTSIYSINKVLQLGMLLDKLSFDHIRIGDHVLIPNPDAQYPNAQTILSALGALTKSVKLATAVTDSYRRNPVEIAQAIATLDILTNGRAVLGIGAGEEMNLRPFGIEWSQPLRRLREAVEVIRRLWMASSKQRTNYEGKIFKLTNAYLQVSPIRRPQPPIYIGAAGPKSRELAGEIADGWIAVAVESPKTLKRHLADLERGVRRSGRNMEKIDVDITIYTDISEGSESRRMVERAAKYMLIQQREVLKELTGLDVPEHLSLQRLDPTDPASATSLEEFAAKIPSSVVEEITALGSPEDCIRKIEAFLKSGATSITVCCLRNEPEKVIDAYAKDILPYLRETYGGR